MGGSIGDFTIADGSVAVSQTATGVSVALILEGNLDDLSPADKIGIVAGLALKLGVPSTDIEVTYSAGSIVVTANVRITPGSASKNPAPAATKASLLVRPKIVVDMHPWTPGETYFAMGDLSSGMQTTQPLQKQPLPVVGMVPPPVVGMPSFAPPPAAGMPTEFSGQDSRYLPSDIPSAIGVVGGRVEKVPTRHIQSPLLDIGGSLQQEEMLAAELHDTMKQQDSLLRRVKLVSDGVKSASDAVLHDHTGDHSGPAPSAKVYGREHDIDDDRDDFAAGPPYKSDSGLQLFKVRTTT